MQESALNVSGNVTQASNASATNASAFTGFSIDVHPLADPIQAYIVAATGISGITADLATAAVIFAIFLAIAIMVRFFVRNVAPHLVKQTDTTLDDEILHAIKNPISVLIVATGAYFAVKSLDNLSVGVVETLDHLALATLILVIAYFCSNLITAVLRWYSKEVAPHTESDLDDHLVPFLEKLAGVVVYIIALLIILSVFGIQITALVASMGVAGIAVALAAQETLSNVFGAVAIMADRPYKVGDRLLLPGIGQGDVVEIGIRSTRVLTRSRQLVVIPNSDMASAEIVNLNMPDARLRLMLKVGVAYNADMDRACKILEEIAASNPLAIPDPRPGAYVSALGDFAVEITLLVWIANYNSDFDATDQMYRQILARFKEEGIEITYPVMTVLPKGR